MQGGQDTTPATTTTATTRRDGGSGSESGHGSDENEVGDDHGANANETETETENGDDHGAKGNEIEVHGVNCGTAALVVNAKVRKADLRFGAQGAEFKKIELVG